jgi:hypothetical protein
MPQVSSVNRELTNPFYLKIKLLKIFFQYINKFTNQQDDDCDAKHCFLIPWYYLSE